MIFGRAGAAGTRPSRLSTAIRQSSRYRRQGAKSVRRRSRSRSGTSSPRRGGCAGPAPGPNEHRHGCRWTDDEKRPQLNHALDVKPKMAPQRLVARDGAPGVLENFMGVIEMGVVEESDAVVEISAHSRDVSSRIDSPSSATVAYDLHFHRLSDHVSRKMETLRIMAP